MLHSPIRISASARTSLLWGSGFMFLGVLLGAFGAHGLKKLVAPELLETWETGARYLLIHAATLLALGAVSLHTSLALTWVRRLLVTGVVLFSFNCFLYVLTGAKAFAMVVPIGGTLLLAGWGTLVWVLCFFTRRELQS